MKVLKTLVLALCATFMLAACGGGSPESVADNFQKALLTGDFKGAAKYATKSTAPMLEQMAGMIPAEQLKAMKDEFKGAKVKVLSSEVEGDDATVTLELTNAAGEVDEVDYELIKEDGSWKVDFKK